MLFKSVKSAMHVGSGLSSSAALVCSASLAILGVYGVALKQGVRACLPRLTPVCPAPAFAGSGLSSSSALVCSSALAFLAAFRVPLPQVVRAWVACYGMAHVKSQNTVHACMHACRLLLAAYHAQLHIFLLS
jgi:galactokinase